MDPRLVLTAGEDQRAGVLVHGEVVQLQLALGIDGEPAGEPQSLRGQQRGLGTWAGRRVAKVPQGSKWEGRQARKLGPSWAPP